MSTPLVDSSILSADDRTLTPMMQQYLRIKKEYADTVLFFRLGDFYEMFFEDAVEVSRLLNLTLTRRADAAMCGVPFHASKSYIARLLRCGKKIAICEQVSVPNGKNLTERRVVEVITPGTTVEEDYLERTESNFTASFCIIKLGQTFYSSLSWLDISTGDFFAQSWSADADASIFEKELTRINPRELLLAKSMRDNDAIQRVLEEKNVVVTYFPDWHFEQSLSFKRLLDQFKTVNLQAFSLAESSVEVIPAGFLIDYCTKNAGSRLSHVTSIKIVNESAYLAMDASAQKNLELTHNLRDASSQFSLLEVLNHTNTPMGSRLLRHRLVYPLTDAERIKKRQKEVALYVDERKKAENLCNILKNIADIERLASRIALDRAHAKDIQSLKNSLYAFSELCKIQNVQSQNEQNAKIIAEQIENAIKDEPSIFLNEGNLIKIGFSSELDHLHQVQDNFSSILDDYIEEEKKATGIQSLKIRYNRVSGYYIEISKANLGAVPDYFILRRAMLNGERYTTARLEELERELVSASEKIIELEARLFVEFRESLKPKLDFFFAIAKDIASLDVALSLAQVAYQEKWCPPQIDENGDKFFVEAGRHPVVEKHMARGNFVPNDFDCSKKNFSLITGPNMAGKSTFLRQNALIAVLAQMGSFVPAKSANLCIVDKIFCRVGASDNLARGESTFLVEMTETANILRSATPKSLVIMDEVGRGTSTEDGRAIAWAVCEYLLNVLKAKTLFATHYHELTKLQHDNLQLLYLEVMENEGEVVFLKRIKEGVAMSSYGIHVAKLAGVPDAVIARAKELLAILSDVNGAKVDASVANGTNETNCAPKINKEPSFFSEEELIAQEIRSINPNAMTPLDALQCIARWKKSLE